MKVIGLMSGTSGDGVDAALVDIRGQGHRLHVVPLAWETYPYPASLHAKLLRISLHGTVGQICHLNAALGEVFARAVLRLIRTAGCPPDEVGIIGSHGQTVQHRPKPVREPGLGMIRSTLQIADPCVIAERTGITTISNFRMRDVAAGGQGAPLTPYVHHILFADRRRSRLIVNIGGISNVTYLPANRGIDSVQAFDTGPGNMILDGLVERITKGKQAIDREGRMASQGRVDTTVLSRLLAHPFLRRKPPKSTGREDFGEPILEDLLRLGKARRLSSSDLLATCARFTADSIGLARRWLRGPVEEVLVGGGGGRNRTVMSALAEIFHPIPVRLLDDIGWNSKAFEAIAFAVLAYQTFRGLPSNVPAATGAARPVILGSLTPGERVRLWTS
jgi:anhydro-N-acetylmuramic acid kinase